MLTTAPTVHALTPLMIEPLPFDGKHSFEYDNASDPYFQSVLEILLTIDDAIEAPAPPMSSVWPQLTTIAIPADNAIHLVSSDDEVVTTPDDQGTYASIHALTMSPGASGGLASRKRLRVETLGEKSLQDDEDSQFQKRLLTNSRRDAVATLREEARALETTLKGLHLRQSRPKSALVSDDPDALVKSYAENIQLKRAIEEQDARIKTLRRAVSLHESKAGNTGDSRKSLLELQLA